MAGLLLQNYESNFYFASRKQRILQEIGFYELNKDVQERLFESLNLEIQSSCMEDNPLTKIMYVVLILLKENAYFNFLTFFIFQYGEIYARHRTFLGKWFGAPHNSNDDSGASNSRKMVQTFKKHQSCF